MINKRLEVDLVTIEIMKEIEVDSNAREVKGRSLYYI
jgi:hypothetical protein